jgi:hypothetical protein
MEKIAVIKSVLIIIIVLLLIWLWHSIYIKGQKKEHKQNNNKSDSKGKDNKDNKKVTVQETFIVTVGDKTLANNFYKKGHNKCFYINGLEAPTVKLLRNVFYAFKNESDEPLYFTDHPEGGDGAPGSLAKNVVGGFKGLANGTIFFEITDDLPIQFYYQSGKHRLMGSAVTIH